MRKGTKNKHHPMQAKGGEGPLLANQGPNQVENKAKPKLKQFNFTQKHHGPRLEAHRRQPTEDGHVWA
jgi:hypothetical protein